MASIVAQLLQPARVSLNVAATGKNDAILEVAEIIKNDPDIVEFDSFQRELIARDELRSTAAGYGVAFPHARTDAVKEIIIAAGRSTAGIPFGEELVHFIFVIGTPREKAGDYLVAVGTLARLLRNEKTRTALAAAASAEEFIQVLTR